MNTRNMLRNISIPIVLILVFMSGITFAQKATITEEKITMKTYPFSDPDPVPRPGRFYPYFYFDGYTNQSIGQEWKMVVLENDFIKVYVSPEIGGKIWGAIEKATGKEFLYFNNVVKFRDVAMRGAWTSGGLEYNFGDIGHIPTCATPVDYQLRNNDDGSVSCIVGAIDLPSRTKWNVEIKLGPENAYFETISSWFNNTGLPCSYYQWMNAAVKADGNLEFIYPGNKQIGHGGEHGEWPVENGREINYYEKNDFGGYKSYHVINSYSDFFGGYWHDDDFGFGHWSTYDDKPGKKLWIWGLSRQGMIWEDLLTEDDGQYIEFQAGKLFNQAANNSTFSPFKHKEFTPFDADVMRELWFPLKQTRGMVDASEEGILNVVRDSNDVYIYLSALQPLKDVLIVKSDSQVLKEEKIDLGTLQMFQTKLHIDEGQEFTVETGNRALYYSSGKDENIVDRPVIAFQDFNWESAYGLYIKALEMEKQRRFDEALNTYLHCLKKEPGYLPALNRTALGLYRKMEYAQALGYIHLALSIDAYDGEANYLFGMIHHKLRKTNHAKSGFSIACGSVQYRNAAYTQLAIIALETADYSNAIYYAKKALDYNQNNITALEALSIAYRKTNHAGEARRALERIEKLDKTHHFYSFEELFLNEGHTVDFELLITNELKTETYLEVATSYYNYNCPDEALRVLKRAPAHPVVLLWMARLNQANESALVNEALLMSPALVFPHRTETAVLLESFIQQYSHWKLKYYLGLIMWNKGQAALAKQLFDQCGEEPDYAAFYLARAELAGLNPDAVAENLHKAVKLAPSDWRVAYARINHGLANNKAEKNLKLGKSYAEKFPENARVGMIYARTLLQSGQYKKCYEFLSDYELLPYEGATEGRNIYHESCIRLAVKELSAGDYTRAIHYAQKAKEWPENLGVGRPYDVDERLDNYMTALAHEKNGGKKKSQEFYKLVADHSIPGYINENAGLLLQLKVLDRFDTEGNAIKLLHRSIELAPENPYLRWVASVYKNNGDSNQIRKEISNYESTVLPYDTKFIDENFALLLDVLEIIE